MHRVRSLTVAQSKRLIAKGMAQHPSVRRAAAEGTLVVAAGTTNGYVIEELTGAPIDKGKYVTGRTLPANYDGPKLNNSLPDFVMRRGEQVDTSAADAVRTFKAGDVFLKGANALNHTAKQAGVLIGHPTGGTVGAMLGTVIARRARLIHPVGLEKSVPTDLCALADRINADAEGEGPTLWVTGGEIFTEIEAIALLTGAQATAASAGGIGGAEGAVWLAVFGDTAQLDAATALLDSLNDEPNFI